MQTKTRSLMLHGLGFVTGDPTIKIGYPYVVHPGIQVTVEKPGDSKWIYMMLPIDRGSLITDIKIAHHRTGFQSHVSLVRIVEQKEPVSATVVFNDQISHSIPSTSVINSECKVMVKNSVLLKVCMEFSNTDDMIEFGSVEIRYIPDYDLSMKEDEKESIIYQFKQEQFENGNRPSVRQLLFGKKKESIISK